MDLIGNRDINSLVDWQVQLQPSEVFIVWENGESVTWKEFAEKTHLYASYFKKLGIKKGTKVVFQYRTSVDLLYMIFGLYKLGAVAVMSNTANTKEDLSYIVEYTNSRYLVMEGGEEDEAFINHVLHQHPVERILINQKIKLNSNKVSNMKEGISLNNGKDVLPRLNLSPDDPATVIFTSGTTAKPKGVIYTHGNHLFSGEIMADILSMDRNDTFMHHFPFFHMNGLGQLFGVLTAGCQLLLFERFRSSVFTDRVEKFHPTITHLNSTHIKMILNHVNEENYRNSSFKTIGFALQMADEHYDRFEKIFGRVLIELYGLTESITIPLVNHPHLKRKRQCLGLPAFGYEVKVVDKNGRENNPFEYGEIILKCYSKHGIMLGYYNKPEETKETIKDGWLYTGDVGYYDEDWYFYMVDRRKDIIKRAGENISAREIEAILESHPSVKEAGVIGIFDEIREEVPKAFIVRNDPNIQEKHIREYCEQKLAYFKVPEYIEFMDKLPKTAVGKIEKKLLRNYGEKRSVNN
ncbi:class I adenylate-forming enzyme family protein [Alteribacillus sp. JSM 102045]|uniref:class I adenylate-forming enzyme family protein n=1 Tax=Alteribacillus sp. JSM 102045 TaxID=1562101 RepID=UPI0035C12988